MPIVDGMHRLAASEPVLSDVVRQRLATLLAEVPARRALEPLPDDLDEEDYPESAPETAVTGSGSPTVGPPVARWARTAWEFSRSHLLALGIVVLTGCLWAGYNVLQARSSPAVAPAPTPAVVATPTPSATPIPAVVVVHVLGAVVSPGVVRLPEGSRVLDAIAAAGGLTPQAAPGELNLAAVLADGAQLVIGDQKQPGGELRSTSDGTAGGGTSPAKVSLNTATQAQLETLPGVGPVTAQKILAWREQHGRFTRVAELQEVDGIGPKTFAQLEPYVGL